MAVLEEIKDNLIKGQYKKIEELVTQAINEDIPPEEILNRGLIAGMEVVGAKFKANEFYIPEVLIAARAMHAGMKILKPLLSKSNVKAKGRIVMGTVKGDLHDIGKNLVCMMLEGAGFEVIDLGVDVSPEKFVIAIREKEPQVVGMSALLTTTMVNMKTTIDVFKQEGVYDKVKVIVGGAPVTQSFADQIGAHGYAPDAASAVDKVKELLNLQN